MNKKRRYLNITHKGYKQHKFILAMELVPDENWYICKVTPRGVKVRLESTWAEYKAISYIMRDYLYTEEAN